MLRRIGVGLVLVMVVGCSHADPSTTAAHGSDSVAPVVKPVVVSTTMASETCSPRAKTKDPGPTRAAKRPELGPPSESAEAKDECVSHAECKAYGHGRCVHHAEREVETFGTRRTIAAHNECVYDECTSDDECRRTGTYEPRAELVCTCDAERNTCTFANCRKDSDCPASFTCGGWHYCHSAADGCRETKDCKAGEDCIYSWDVKHYICKHQQRIAPD